MSYNPILKIDINKVKNNIKTLKKDKEVCLIVKANGYGILEDIKPLYDLGYRFYGVSTLDEAIKITSIYSDVDVLILSPIDSDEITKVNNKIILTVSSFNDLNNITNQRFHLAFDTGMGRIGFKQEEIIKIKNKITDNMNFEGIFTHFPKAYDKVYSNNQIKLFKAIIDQFKEYNLKYIHMQNTIGCLLYDIDFCNLVRPGIGIWGYVEDIKTNELEPSLELIAPIIQKKEYNDYLGYDLIEKVNGKVATIKMGYNDGLIRGLQNYKFKEGTLVGKVCMCQSMFLLNEDNYNTDKITIIEKNDSLDNLVKYAKITKYEFLTGLSTRIKKEIK